MQISNSDLYRIVLEEYIREEGGEDNLQLNLREMDEQKFKDFLAWIQKKGPRPEWLDDKGRTIPEPPSTDDTWPMEKPHSADMGDEEIVASISNMVQGKDPEHVSELFQMVFEKLPGVELSSPDDEDYPGEETLYSPGAEGRPAISLGPIREHIANQAFKKLIEAAGLSYGARSMAGITGKRDDDEEEVAEGHYHDMGGEDEMYDVMDSDPFAVAHPEDLDHEKFEQAWADDPSRLSDIALVNYAKKYDLDKIIVYDGDRDLANREELEAVLADEIPKLQASDRY